MFHLLDETLEAFLREEVPLPQRQVDMSFEAPDQDWSAKVSRPTVNLFLWDVRQNLTERLAGRQFVEEDGRRYRRTPPLRIDCRYLVTAWTSEVDDEHQLLGAVLVALLSHSEIAPGYLKGLLAPVRPLPSLSVASPAETASSDFWSAVGGKLKPGLDLVVTASVDTALMKEAGPPVEQYTLNLKRRPRGTTAGAATLVGGRAGSARAGQSVSGPRGSAVVAATGDFVIAGLPGDTIDIAEEASVDRASGVVPAAGAIDLEAARAEPRRRGGRNRDES